MKKFISVVLTFVFILCAFSSCSKAVEGYTYSVDEYSISIWGGAEIYGVAIDASSCSLVFNADKKTIKFICGDDIFTGELVNQNIQEGSDLWKVKWDEDPVGNSEYEFSYSAFNCSSNYDKASPFVQLLFYFDGENNSIEARFSMKADK